MPNNAGHEGRLELAIRVVKTGQIPSVMFLKLLYHQDWLNGIKGHVLAHRTQRKLTETEEETLLQWILTMDKRGAPLRPTTVRRMADLLLADRDASKPSPTVGIN